MNPLLDLKKLLFLKDKSLAGKVVSVGDGKLQVRTPVGIITATKSDSTNYKEGDTVLIEKGVIKGKLKDEASIPIYTV